MEDGKEQEMDMDSKNYTQVLIDGKIYTLGGMEDEGYLQKTASYVNETRPCAACRALQSRAQTIRWPW